MNFPRSQWLWKLYLAALDDVLRSEDKTTNQRIPQEVTNNELARVAPSRCNSSHGHLLLLGGWCEGVKHARR